jgi:hypothetical protein
VMNDILALVLQPIKELAAGRILHRTRRPESPTSISLFCGRPAWC